MISCLQSPCCNPTLLGSSSSSYSFPNTFKTNNNTHHHHYPNGIKHFNRFKKATISHKNPTNFVVNGLPFPVDPWSPTIDSQSIASQLFAFSLFPYIGFLYFITRSNSAPKLTLFGFYFLLAFVGATTKVQYGTSLSNVDWLHGGAESLLTLTNLFIVIGLRQALRKANQAKELVPDAASEVPDDNTPSA
ncbi:hypothetical protein OSB04_010442 [Centaurea solstitialis]|uniref:Uncharacterized protein n=1 Tax=Centaurea solstitialis TaxID=347529 RepID=A0AA38TF62_9ASTR|nr:hypothetical protein OSB04_010442 [Centaurea solstitialis]